MFGSAEKDARHWNAALLEIFQTHADTLWLRCSTLDAPDDRFFHRGIQEGRGMHCPAPLSKESKKLHPAGNRAGWSFFHYMVQLNRPWWPNRSPAFYGSGIDFVRSSMIWRCFLVSRLQLASKSFCSSVNSMMSSPSKKN